MENNKMEKGGVGCSQTEKKDQSRGHRCSLSQRHTMHVCKCVLHHLQRYLAVNRVSINHRSHQRTFKYQEQTLGFIWSTSPQSCSPNKLHFVMLTFFGEFS